MPGTSTDVRRNKLANNVIWLLPLTTFLSVTITTATGGRRWSSAALYGLAALVVATMFIYSVVQVRKVADQRQERTPRTVGR